MVDFLGGTFGTTLEDDDEQLRATIEAQYVAQEIYGLANDLVDLFNQHPSYWDAEHLAHLHEMRGQLRNLRADALINFKLRWQRRS